MTVFIKVQENQKLYKQAKYGVNVRKRKNYFTVLKEIRDWCNSMCDAHWYVHQTGQTVYCAFMSEKDAMVYRLTWGGEIAEIKKKKSKP